LIQRQFRINFAAWKFLLTPFFSLVVFERSFWKLTELNISGISKDGGGSNNRFQRPVTNFYGIDTENKCHAFAFPRSSLPQRHQTEPRSVTLCRFALEGNAPVVLLVLAFDPAYFKVSTLARRSALLPSRKVTFFCRVVTSRSLDRSALSASSILQKIKKTFKKSVWGLNSLYELTLQLDSFFLLAIFGNRLLLASGKIPLPERPSSEELIRLEESPLRTEEYSSQYPFDACNAITGFKRVETCVVRFRDSVKFKRVWLFNCLR